MVSNPDAMWIVRLALRRPYTTAVLSFVILLLGTLSITRMRADIFPTIDIPVVIVVWNYPGMPAEEMERRIIIISERGYSTTVDGITRIESQSIAGIGLMKVYFEPTADIEFSARILSDKGRSVQAKVFRASVPVVAMNAPSAASALDQAFGACATELVTWAAGIM